MRILTFDVDGQRIRKNSKCSFSGLVAGSKGYLKLSFNFSSDWALLSKVAIIRTKDDKRYYLPIFDGMCDLDDESATETKLYVSVVGANKKTTVSTNETSFTQLKARR